MNPVRYKATDLQHFANTVLQETGLISHQAECVADILLEGDLMGHGTHGLQLLGSYLKELESGLMTRNGEPAIIADHPAAFTWDGNFLPGPWLIIRAMEAAFERMPTQPVVTGVIRRSHHIACLAAYLKRATDRGFLMLLTCSDPAVKSVAPYGGVAARYTPNPLAVGFPTEGDPVLIDISMSTTTNGMVHRLNRQKSGQHLPGPWLVDNQGNATGDPSVFLTDPPGAILPLGGMDLGHKGFALGLAIEAMTSALGGYGRADGETRWGASVFMQLIDPNAFGGRERFVRETQWFAEACRTTPVKSGNPPVRLPGAHSLALRAEQLANGVALHPEILPSLAPWSEKFGVPLPQKI